MTIDTLKHFALFWDLKFKNARRPTQGPFAIICNIPYLISNHHFRSLDNENLALRSEINRVLMASHSETFTQKEADLSVWLCEQKACQSMFEVYARGHGPWKSNWFQTWESCSPFFKFNHEAHLHWQKPKIQTTWVFCCTVYTARKTHNIACRKAHARKNPNPILFFFGKWCACATSLYLWPYVVRITSRAAVGWFCRRSRTTWPKTRIIPARLEQAFTLAKKPWKTGGVSKNPTPECVFRFRFFAVFRGSCLATSHKKPECTTDSGFLMQV